jgi:hypothetical protein
MGIPEVGPSANPSVNGTFTKLTQNCSWRGLPVVRAGTSKICGVGCHYFPSLEQAALCHFSPLLPS